jgi:hypothetical protein
MRLLCVALALALLGCHSEVDITVALTTPAVASATQALDFEMSGADSTHVVVPTPHAFLYGSERVIYQTPASGTLAIAVAALDAAGQPLAGGATTVQLHGGVATATVLLGRGGKTAASRCRADWECASGFCTDGVCCNERCDGQCEACNLASSPGMCTAVSGPPVEPRAACGTGAPCSEQCDGVARDACGLPGGATACQQPTCAGGAAVSAHCDGNGGCVQVMQACGSFACASGVCASSCTDDTSCVPGAYCNGMSCQPWSPSLLNGLVLWLDPDRGLASPAGITKWSDQSPAGNDAVAVDAPAPSIVTTRNGHAGVHFASAGGYFDLGDSASLRWGTSPFVIELVTRFGQAPNSVLYKKHDDSGPPYLGALLGASSRVVVAWLEQGCVVQNQPGEFFDNDTWHVIGMRRDGNGLELRIDGAVDNSQPHAPFDISVPGQHATIGGSTNGGSIEGDIAEFVIFVGDDSLADAARLEAYLKVKYNL